jgi:hypothetical protein
MVQATAYAPTRISPCQMESMTCADMAASILHSGTVFVGQVHAARLYSAWTFRRCSLHSGAFCCAGALVDLHGQAAATVVWRAWLPSSSSSASWTLTCCC